MKDSNYLEIYTNPIDEARRYVQNAKDILNENGKLDTELQLYTDRKYIRMAGNTLWNGVLVILDAVFHVKSKKRQHPDVGDYRDAIAVRDKKLLSLFIAGYEVMHVAMGYDGVLKKSISNDGIQLANEIIDRCAAMLG